MGRVKTLSRYGKHWIQSLESQKQWNLSAIADRVFVDQQIFC